jgi:hypothetical protein
MTDVASPHAPVALFVYRRSRKLKAVLDSLERCKEFATTPVFIFSDGPADLAAEADVQAVRALLAARKRDNVRVIEHPLNKGCDRSIIDGVTQLCAEYGRLIVLEDDLILSPAILAWFNTALNAYAEDERIMQVSGHMFDVPALANRTTGLVLPITTSWGWATWQRSWRQFDPAANGWRRLLSDVGLRKAFDLGNRYPWFKLLKSEMESATPGKTPVWDVRWYWTVFKLGGVSVYPPRSMVANIGADSLATHGTWKSRARGLFRARRRLPILPPGLPLALSVDWGMMDQVSWAAFLRSI